MLWDGTYGLSSLSENEMSVMVAAPVALLAQGYTKIFLGDIEADTLHGAFNIPVDRSSSSDINYGLNKFDMVVVDESSMISCHTFEKMAATFNRLNLRPVVLFAGDKCQQQPLQTVDGRTSATTSIINDNTFNPLNAVHHTLYQQFRITDPTYAAFFGLHSLHPALSTAGRRDAGRHRALPSGTAVWWANLGSLQQPFQRNRNDSLKTWRTTRK